MMHQASPKTPPQSAAAPVLPLSLAPAKAPPQGALTKQHAVASLFALDLEFSNQEEPRRATSPALASIKTSENARNSSPLRVMSGVAELAAVSAGAVEQEKTPVTDPQSPAYRALATSAESPTGKKGRSKYIADRSFKKPEGNEIHVQHEQYALTYGMMCGILNSAGAQNQFKQRLSMDDFMRVDKRSFPASAKLQHPFKFKDYSPDIFRQIRRRFCIDSADYMVTLCGDFNFIEFMSNSKSGQFFFYSHDGRFMIKTQTKDESKFLRRILPHYYKFVMENPNTLITRFYGMHRVKMYHLRRKMHFIIMASVFDTPLEIHGRFDLKGSKIGRRASQKERTSNGVLKDLDLIESGFRLQMGPERRAMLLVQVRKDVEFLKRMKIMDYSMLIGIHDSRQAIHQSIYALPAAAPSVQCADVASYKSAPTTPTGSHGTSDNAGLADSIIPVRLSRSVSLPQEPTNCDCGPGSMMDTPGSPSYRDSEATATVGTSSPPSGHGISFDSDDDSDDAEDSHSTDGVGEIAVDGTEMHSMSVNLVDMPLSPGVLDAEKYGRSESIFCKDDGGIYGRDRYGRKNGFVYFLGVIDILQQYNTRKIAETFFKGFRHNRKQISSVNPNFYGDRFIEFMEKYVVMDDTLPASPASTMVPAPRSPDTAYAASGTADDDDTQQV